MAKKLGRQQHRKLCEALRRYTRFGEGKPLTEAWTGLGSATDYRPGDGLMEIATSSNPGYSTWWRLTPKGAALVQTWLDRGFTYIDIEAKRLPLA